MPKKYLSLLFYDKKSKTVVEGIKKIEEGNVVKKIKLAFFDYFNRFLSNRCVFDSFCFFK